MVEAHLQMMGMMRKTAVAAECTVVANLQEKGAV